MEFAHKHPWYQAKKTQKCQQNAQACTDHGEDKASGDIPQQLSKEHGLLMPAAPRGSDGIPSTLLPAGETKLSVYNLYRVACEDSDIPVVGLTSFQMYHFFKITVLLVDCTDFIPTFDSGFRMAIFDIASNMIYIFRIS